MTDLEKREHVAAAMYERHRNAAPAWKDMSPGFQKWMLEQAEVAIDTLTALEDIEGI